MNPQRRATGHPLSSAFSVRRDGFKIGATATIWHSMQAMAHHRPLLRVLEVEADPTGLVLGAFSTKVDHPRSR